MEKKMITLSICNQIIAVSIDAEQEGRCRMVAKSINDEFAKCKDLFANAPDDKLMAYLLLQTGIKAVPSKEKKPSLWARLSQLIKEEE